MRARDVGRLCLVNRGTGEKGERALHRSGYLTAFGTRDGTQSLRINFPRRSRCVLIPIELVTISLMNEVDNAQGAITSEIFFRNQI